MHAIKKDDIHVRVFQHTPAEPLGYFEDIFAEENISYEYVRLWDNDPVISRSATHLIFLGGPMSVNDEGKFPWLNEEKKSDSPSGEKADTCTRSLPRCPADRLITRSSGIQI